MMPPRLIQAKQTFKVISQGSKKFLAEKDYTFPVDRERILHSERMDTDDTDTETVTPNKKVSPRQALMMQTMITTPFWPTELCAADFRGQQGIMCVSNAHTICTAVPLLLLDGKSTSTTTTHATDGPFSEYRAEVGLSTQQLRFRIKLDYAILPNYFDKKEKEQEETPPLYLRSLVVCREMREVWPLQNNEALFGIPGADNGLYDPPPVGTDEQAAQYLQMDLDGHATALFPYKMDQTVKNKQDKDDDLVDRNGWVISLDWTPGNMRYQVDRKYRSGKQLLGLRTLELSEVQSVNAERFRPRDGRTNMRH
jgi:hypothetical protein